jgi:hypothetical protein
MNVLVACESSGVVREAFRAKGHNAWSCDLLPADDGSKYHIQEDARDAISGGWDLLIAHPPCTRLTNSGVRWLSVPPKGRTLESMWKELDEGVELYLALRDAHWIPKRAIENPIMHCHAAKRINPGPRQIVQPWWFGEPYFKATGFELIGLPPLKPTDKLQPPAKGTEEYKQWSMIHRASPGPDRWKIRSKTFQGVADAMAEQWG